MQNFRVNLLMQFTETAIVKAESREQVEEMVDNDDDSLEFTVQGDDELVDMTIQSCDEDEGE